MVLQADCLMQKLSCRWNLHIRYHHCTNVHASAFCSCPQICISRLQLCLDSVLDTAKNFRLHFVVPTHLDASGSLRPYSSVSPVPRVGGLSLDVLD